MLDSHLVPIDHSSSVKHLFEQKATASSVLQKIKAQCAFGFRVQGLGCFEQELSVALGQDL